MSIFQSLIISIRPKQWSKNIIVFAAVLFSRNIFNPHLSLTVATAFVVFCMITGATYLLNDIADRENDRHHPEKAVRPIASGRLSAGMAGVSAAAAVAVGLCGAWMLHPSFFSVTAAYLLLQLLYTFLLKRIVILDVLAITTGFVLRVLAGAVVIDVEISSWLLICTFLLALFLALCKRRHELTLLEEGAGKHRKVLQEYSISLLDQMISMTTASTLIAYTLYTLSDRTVAKFGTEKLVFTVPFVVYGIFRYLYLVHIKKAGGSPEMLLLTDLPLVGGIIGWGVCAGLIIYF
ncbi:MAG: decaprenyl-phosphate phosphoribosyltransferase [Chitinispirillaceae bacterium]|nr:decaprenyl-phosphate phosphoribosyltransferase [Chitinispirillaceae bacterium]